MDHFFFLSFPPFFFFFFLIFFLGSSPPSFCLRPTYFSPPSSFLLTFIFLSPPFPSYNFQHCCFPFVLVFLYSFLITPPTPFPPPPPFFFLFPSYYFQILLSLHCFCLFPLIHCMSGFLLFCFFLLLLLPLF